MKLDNLWPSAGEHSEEGFVVAAQVHTNDGGATFNVQKSGGTIVGMTDNGGTPAGVGTGVWGQPLHERLSPP